MTQPTDQGGERWRILKRRGSATRSETEKLGLGDISARANCIVQSKTFRLVRKPPPAAVTFRAYETLQQAYDYFNAVLFDGRLPQVLITLQRRRRTLGYFADRRFRGRGKIRARIHEVALNPDGFVGKSDEEILSTLVHEMVHVWQQEYGSPGRGRYHNKAWAEKMHSIGLMPSSTGKEGGATTGDRMSHYILSDGRFLSECQAFLDSHELSWESAAAMPAAKMQTRATFTCPNCGLNGWAKPDAEMDCHGCSAEAGEQILMQKQAD